jgi:hypothetical protein
VIVGASGQRIMITLGLSAGWTKTISIVSSDWLMAPGGEGRGGMLGQGGLLLRLGPELVLTTPLGADLCGLHV